MKDVILQSTRLPRLIFLTGLLLLTIIVACCSGCASVEQFAEDHPAVVVGTGLVLVAGAAVAVAYETGKHNQVNVVRLPPPNGCYSRQCEK